MVLMTVPAVEILSAVSSFVLARFIPPIHRFLAGLRDMAFYLWAVALAIVTGQTVKSLVNSEAEIYVEILIALGGLITCIAQFYWGKRIGKKYNDRISAGQALGQKNTVLAIWMSYTYLNPLSSVGPGSYVCGKIFLTVISCGKREIKNWKIKYR